MAKQAPDDPMGPKSVNHNLSAISAMFSWCMRKGLIPDSPVRGLMVQIKRRANLESAMPSGPRSLKVIFDALAGGGGAAGAEVANKSPPTNRTICSRGFIPIRLGYHGCQPSRGGR
jgi:hypothetical protein